MGGRGAGARRKVAALISGALMAVVASGPAGAQPLGDEALFVWGVSAHAEWEFVKGDHVTRYAAHAVRYVSDVYPGEVHTDVGVLRRRCRLSKFNAGTCQFHPKNGVDEDVDVFWDPSLSEVRLTFSYREHEHTVEWKGLGDHDVDPQAYTPPGLVGASAFVSRRASASGTIYGDRVRPGGVVPEETYMWEGGWTWKWVSAP